jgi:hypothetical protein
LLSTGACALFDASSIINAHCFYEQSRILTAAPTFLRHFHHATRANIEHTLFIELGITWTVCSAADFIICSKEARFGRRKTGGKLRKSDFTTRVNIWVFAHGDWLQLLFGAPLTRPEPKYHLLT